MENVDFYFQVNEITHEKKKKNIFLSSCEHKIYSILCDIIFPEALNEIRYSNLFAKMKAYFTSTPSEICRTI